MEYARLQLYIPDKFGNQKKFAIFERHQFWTSAAFILIIYTAWTLYRIKRPSISLMESIIIQRMEDTYNEIMKEKNGADQNLEKSSHIVLTKNEGSKPTVKKVNILKGSPESTVFNKLEEEVRNIEITDLLMNTNDKKHLEEVTVMYEMNANDMANSDTSSNFSSDSSTDLWTDNDRKTVYHVSEEENNQTVEDIEEKYSDTEDDQSSQVDE